MHNSIKTSLSKPILVVAGIILSPVGTSERREVPGAGGDRVLLARRKLDAFLEAGKWEFPGGKVEPLEHPEATLIREIREELDLEIRVECIFDVASHIYDTEKGPVHIVLLCYLCRASSEQFRLLDVSDARWVESGDLNQFDYAAADVETVGKLAAYLGE